MLISWWSAIWGIIVMWDWQIIGPIVAALAAGLTALATIVYTVGTLLLWATTRRSVREMENVVKLTFLQTLYATEKPSAMSTTRGNFGERQLHKMEDHYRRQQFRTALEQTFPELYTAVSTKAQTTATAEP